MLEIPISEARICNRCGSIILENRTLFTVQEGLWRPNRNGQVVLCLDCAKALANWLAEGKAVRDELPADVDPPADWPPQAGRSATTQDLGGMSRFDRSRLIDALTERPHTSGSIRAYVLPRVSAAEVHNALEELHTHGMVEAEEQRTRTGKSMTVYRWATGGSR